MIKLANCGLDCNNHLLCVIPFVLFKNFSGYNSYQSFNSLFFKIYHSILKVQSHYSSEDYQNTIDDYFTLGFDLGIQIDEIRDNYQND